MSCNRWEGKRVTGTLSCSLRGGPAGSFNGLKRGMGLGAARGWSAHHFGDAGHRDHEQDPGFAPDASEAAFGCLVFFGILLSIICPNCACLRLLLVLIISLYSVLKEMFAQVQALQQRVPSLADLTASPHPAVTIVNAPRAAAPDAAMHHKQQHHRGCLCCCYNHHCSSTTTMKPLPLLWLPLRPHQSRSQQ